MDSRGPVAQRLEPRGQFIAATNIEAINVIDKHTVEFVLKRPNAFFKEYLRQHPRRRGPGGLQQERFDKMGPEAATTGLPDGGTGPYEIESWTADTEIVLKAFPDYWGEKPAYERVRLMQIHEPSTVMAALETGQWTCAKIPVTARERAEAAGLGVRERRHRLGPRSSSRVPVLLQGVRRRADPAAARP